MNNNVFIFVFGFIFLVLGFLSPMINGEFDNPYTESDSTALTELDEKDFSITAGVSFLSGMLVWVFGAPVWLNLLITMMRVMFWIIIYDKFRGIGS